MILLDMLCSYLLPMMNIYHLKRKKRKFWKIKLSHYFKNKNNKLRSRCTNCCRDCPRSTIRAYWTCCARRGARGGISILWVNLFLVSVQYFIFLFENLRSCIANCTPWKSRIACDYYAAWESTWTHKNCIWASTWITSHYTGSWKRVSSWSCSTGLNSCSSSQSRITTA